MKYFKTLVCFLSVVVFFRVSQAAKISRPVSLLAQLNVRDVDPIKTEIYQVQSSYGVPVGIIVKRRSEDRRKRQTGSVEDEIIEIIGIRMPDDISDRTNVYRNAKIVDNKLIMKKHQNQ